MSGGSYRQIHIKIWTDEWFLDLQPHEKLLFIYLFSNGRTNMIGLYDLPPKVIAFETGLEPEVIEATLSGFERAGKIARGNGLIWVKKMLDYNGTRLPSPTIQTHIRSIFALLRDCPVKASAVEHYNRMVGPAYRIEPVSMPQAGAAEAVPGQPECPGDTPGIPYRGGIEGVSRGPAYGIERTEPNRTEPNHQNCVRSTGVSVVQEGLTPEPTVPAATPPPAIDKPKRKPRALAPAPPPGVQVFKAVTGHNPPKALYEDIGQAVGSKVENTEFWARVIKGWIGCGRNPQNVSGMLEHYGRREIPSTKPNGAGNGRPPPPDDFAPPPGYKWTAEDAPAGDRSPFEKFQKEGQT